LAVAALVLGFAATSEVRADQRGHQRGRSSFQYNNNRHDRNDRFDRNDHWRRPQQFSAQRWGSVHRVDTCRDSSCRFDSCGRNRYIAPRSYGNSGYRNSGFGFSFSFGNSNYGRSGCR
jgi:hypothetical protein